MANLIEIRGMVNVVIARLDNEPTSAAEWRLIARACEQAARAARKAARDSEALNGR